MHNPGHPFIPTYHFFLDSTPKTLLWRVFHYGGGFSTTCPRHHLFFSKHLATSQLSVENFYSSIGIPVIKTYNRQNPRNTTFGYQIFNFFRLKMIINPLRDTLWQRKAATTESHTITTMWVTLSFTKTHVPS